MLNGLMQDRPLMISSLLSFAAKAHPDRKVVSWLPEGGVHRTNYRKTLSRAKALAQALLDLGVKPGDRVATLAWNTHRHLELFYAVSGIGAVLHTVNPRLFPNQLDYIINHGAAKTLFFDCSFIDLVRGLAPKLGKVTRYVALHEALEDFPEQGKSAIGYEDLLARYDDSFEWPEFDENTASSMCYTSGTTGDPKGVLYSHRSTLLHAMVAAQSNAFGLAANDTVMPLAPMFHANAWAMPYIAPMTGAALVLTADVTDAPGLTEIINTEKVTFSVAVPTIWKTVLDHLDNTGGTLESLNRVAIGGTAVPRSMTETFRDKHNVDVQQIWGMTETSPLGVCGTPIPELDDLDEEAAKSILFERQGRLQYGIDLRIVDDVGRILPHDGVAFGRLQVKGPWVAGAYMGQDPGAALTEDGWFDTGDISTIDGLGYMRITDRAKDVIKTGGEWISSVDLENIASGHPDLALAAVVGVPHPKWDERPILLAIPKPGAEITGDCIRDYLTDRIVKWWMPDKFYIVDKLPMTATGKIDKKVIRAEYEGVLAEG